MQQRPDDIIRNMYSSNNQRPRGFQVSGRQPGVRILNRVSSSSLRQTGRIGQRNLGPVDYANYMQQNPSRSFEYYGLRIPYGPSHSTPASGAFNYPSRFETFDSQIDHNMNINDVVDSSIVMAAQARRNISIKNPKKDLKENSSKPSPTYSHYSDSTPETKDTRYLLNHPKLEETEFPSNPAKRSPKQESIMEWFDRTVEKELRKRREGTLNVGENFVNVETASSSGIPKKRSSNPLITEASTSGLDIQARLRKANDTELSEAVDKLAKAEAMCSFEGAVRAAEKAAASAPQEFAEEAAAASAQGYQAQLTGVVRQEFDGVKPIEVVGYVGITRPKKPKKPESPQ